MGELRVVETRCLQDLAAVDGTVHVDGAVVDACSTDFGRIVHRRPLAVVKPGSVQDVVRTVQVARAHRLKLAVRGQGHSTHGQSLVAGGLVLDMSTLDAILDVRPEAADVQGGARWSQLLDATLPAGWTPPVLTDYLDLSIGGTLSVGGVGGTSHAWGLQVDNVSELEVVTGAGEVRTCSAHRDPDLFGAVLGGLGQAAVLVRATVDLVPAPAHVRSYHLRYDDLSHLTADQVGLIRHGRGDHVQGRITVGEGVPWEFHLDAARFHDGSREPSDATLLGGLRYRGAPEVEDRTYHEFAHRLDDAVVLEKQRGSWDLPHPWFDALVPAGQVDDFVAGVLTQVDAEDLVAGLVLVYPLHRDRLSRPLVRGLDEDVVFQFDVLCTAPPDREAVARRVARNRRLYEQVSRLGGRRYPIGTIPFHPDDWRRHLGRSWQRLRDAKARYDPDDTLNPGHGVFTSPVG